jgi:glycosyltransferase involved in cell wall biosynthesis
MIEICLCTHNPRREVLDLVLRSIAAQTVPAGCFLFLLVDNASSPAVPETVLTPLRDRGISSRLVQEPRPGIFHARNRAMRESKQPLILWIDDDTEFPADYVSKCLAIAAAHPEIGCFGGKLLQDPNCRFARWMTPILPWLAILDRGGTPITNKANHWGLWEPPTAGAVVRRAVIDHYLGFVAQLPKNYSIGQVGNRDLMRGEDSLLMRMAYRIDLACSYQPSLQLVHHIDNRRFKFCYLCRLFYGYGRSYVRLEKILGDTLPPMSPRSAWEFLWNTRLRKEQANWGIFLLMKAWNLGFIVERTVRRT